MNTATHSLKFLLLMATVFFSACQVEDLPPIKESAQTGRIVLSLPEVQLYTEGSTRADGNIADYTYTLNSAEGSVHVVSDSTITFTDGSAIIPAGTYTLTATSNTAQDAGPWYQGTSDAFPVGIGGTKSVEINLGKPRNVEVAVTFDKSFTNLYENYSVTIGEKSVSADGPLYAMPGNITYTVKGSAKAGSHVSDIPASGITGTINAVAGTSYPLNITVNPVSGVNITIAGSPHTGEFD